MRCPRFPTSDFGAAQCISNRKAKLVLTYSRQTPSWFFQHRQEWELHVLVEMRVRVAAERVRIPDVCLVARGGEIEQVLTKPPLTVIEILSPEDRISRYNERLADYRRMGIPNVWVIDPANRVGYDCSTAAWLPNEEFRIAGSPIFLRLNDLWSELQANR